MPELATETKTIQSRETVLSHDHCRNYYTLPGIFFFFIFGFADCLTILMLIRCLSLPHWICCHHPRASVSVWLSHSSSRCVRQHSIDYLTQWGRTCSVRKALETFKPFFPETVDSQRSREGSQSRVAHPVIPGLGGLRQERWA